MPLGKTVPPVPLHPGPAAESMPTGGFATSVAILYGIACHVAFIIAVVAMIVEPFSGMNRAWGTVPFPWSLACNALLLLQFPILHTFLLSRRGSGLLQRMAPAGLGRPLMSTTYALIASLQTILLFLGWTPSHHILWQARGMTLVLFEILYAGSWLLLAKAVTDAGFALQTGLLGWRAVVRRRQPVYPPMPTRGLFAWCRQPIYLAFALIMITPPTITPDELAISGVLVAYCLIGPLFKEARFSRRFGADFAAYRARTSYWLPGPRRAQPVIAKGDAAPAE